MMGIIMTELAMSKDGRWRAAMLVWMQLEKDSGTAANWIAYVATG